MYPVRPPPSAGVYVRRLNVFHAVLSPGSVPFCRLRLTLIWTPLTFRQTRNTRAWVVSWWGRYTSGKHIIPVPGVRMQHITPMPEHFAGSVIKYYSYQYSNLLRVPSLKQKPTLNTNPAGHNILKQYTRQPRIARVLDVVLRCTH